MRERLFVCGFVCVYHPARVRLPASLRLRDLAQVAHITTSYSSLSVSMIDSQLQAQGLERRVIASCASLLAIPAVLEQVCAVAVLPDIIARAISSAQSPLQLQPVVDSPPAIQIEYVWHPRLTHDPLHNWIRHQLRSLAPRCAMEPPLQQ
jgi:DNA-binding transcriptional LysR family regulator